MRAYHDAVLLFLLLFGVFLGQESHAERKSLSKARPPLDKGSNALTLSMLFLGTLFRN